MRIRGPVQQILSDGNRPRPSGGERGADPRRGKQIRRKQRRFSLIRRRIAIQVAETPNNDSGLPGPAGRLAINGGESAKFIVTILSRNHLTLVVFFPLLSEQEITMRSEPVILESPDLAQAKGR